MIGFLDQDAAAFVPLPVRDEEKAVPPSPAAPRSRSLPSPGRPATRTYKLGRRRFLCPHDKNRPGRSASPPGQGRKTGRHRVYAMDYTKSGRDGVPAVGLPKTVNDGSRQQQQQQEQQ